MRRKVLIPMWQLIVGGLLAAAAVLDRLLLPSVRWFFRQRANQAITRVNKRLRIQLPAFKLTKRRVLIDRLVYDPSVLEAVEEYSRSENIPNVVAVEKVERYAREIVPSFNAYIYFRLGTWLSKTVARFLYRVRLGYSDENALAHVDPSSSVVFVMNHRSNMDYILLAHIAAEREALSYAVGEWARIWPIQQLIQAMGAFFVRRGSGDMLYRRVLERYVQMATENGVVQAMFPEGGLSKDGALRTPKIGLLDYMLRQFDAEGARDLVFIPVGVNYDRVLEDRTLLRGADPQIKPGTSAYALRRTLRFGLHNLGLMLRGGWHRFGYAVVNFGPPISTRAYARQHGIDFRSLDRPSRIAHAQQLAQTMMQAIGQVVPVVPVALVAAVFMSNPTAGLSSLELKARVQELWEELENQSAYIYIPRNDREYAVEVGLRMLTLRHLVGQKGGLYQPVAKNLNVLQFYANSIAHLVPGAPARPGEQEG
jgi:glycerol-3-phosphate O-acyltransferase